MRSLQLHRQGIGNPQGQRFLQRTCIDAAAARQHASFRQKRDQASFAELGAQGHLVLHGVHVGTQRAEVEPLHHLSERPVQSARQQFRGGPPEDPAARRGQSR